MRLYRCSVFFFQAEDGIRDLVRSRGLGDVYKRQAVAFVAGVMYLIQDGLLKSKRFNVLYAKLPALDLSLIHI